jgi:hypothetical protein
MYSSDDMIDLIQSNIDSFVSNEKPVGQDINTLQIHEDKLKNLITQLCYYNYSNWQHENNARSSDDSVSLKGYRSTVGSNHNRNKTIEKIDELNLEIQNIDANDILPTTLGIILDAITILYLKLTYVKELKDKVREDQILHQIKEMSLGLTQSLKKVFDDRASRFLRLDKIKVYNGNVI